jgi:hypothetical protein
MWEIYPGNLYTRLVSMDYTHPVKLQDMVYSYEASAYVKQGILLSKISMIHIILAKSQNRNHGEINTC